MRAVTPKYFASPDEFRAWLTAHHDSARELLVGFYKRATGKPSMTWRESVDEALCFGWIDGVRRSVSDEAYCIRFTPRRPTSIWSAVNVARVQELSRLGKMSEAGLRAFAARTPERTGVYSFERAEAAKLSEDEEQKLRANAKAAKFFFERPPWYRRTALHWVISAKRAETRQRRLAQLITDSAAERTLASLTRPAKKTAAKKKRAKKEP